MVQGKVRHAGGKERSAVLDRWLERIGQDHGAVWLPATESDPFRDPVRHVLRQNLTILLDEAMGEINLEAAQTALQNIIRIRVVQSLTATQSVQFLFHLNPILREVLTAHDLSAVDANLEKLTALAFKKMRAAERIAELRLNELRRMAHPAARGSEPTQTGSGAGRMTALGIAGTLAMAATAPREYAPAAWQIALCVVLPYVAVAVFLVGMCCRVIRWTWSPVPFRIPTTCGQQKTLPWIKCSSIDNPSGGLGAVARMALEILCFRSLFRNSRAEMHNGNLVYGESKWLWLGALAFHWALLLVVLRHLRLFVQPVPVFVTQLIRFDGIFQVGLPAIYLSDVALTVALLYLLFRRMRDPLAHYLSRFEDYFALLLLLSVAGTGMWMRYVMRADVVNVKRMALGLATFHPVVPQVLNAVFLTHLVLVCTLAIYFPFGKLVHMGGVFLSPTRNLANNNRSKRHINPWNRPVKTHRYVEWEQEYRERITAAGIPLDEGQP